MGRRIWMAISGLCILGASVGATGEVTHERLDMPAGRVRTIVAQAIAEASRRLEDPTCQQVLTDFTDRAGHTLLANLIALDSTTAQYLTLVWFVDAPDGALCRGTGTVAAFTQPGSRVVSVCAAHFAELPYSSREIVILHEMLHTLGLGENPPSSAEITKQVAFRCASSR